MTRNKNKPRVRKKKDPLGVRHDHAPAPTFIAPNNGPPGLAGLGGGKKKKKKKSAASRGLVNARQAFEACATRPVASWLDVACWLHYAYAFVEQEPGPFRGMFLSTAANAGSLAGAPAAGVASLQQLCQAINALPRQSAGPSQVRTLHQ
jgi:hypothetical protein